MGVGIGIGPEIRPRIVFESVLRRRGLLGPSPGRLDVGDVFHGFLIVRAEGLGVVSGLGKRNGKVKEIGYHDGNLKVESRTDEREARERIVVKKKEKRRLAPAHVEGCILGVIIV